MSNLQEFHHAEVDETKGLKMAIGSVIAILVVGFAVYVWQSGMLNPPPAAPAATHQLHH